MGTHHDVDLLLDLGEHGIVGDRDALENMVGGAVDGCRGADEVDVRRRSDCTEAVNLAVSPHDAPP